MFTTKKKEMKPMGGMAEDCRRAEEEQQYLAEEAKELYEENREVELRASSYEWTCSNCSTLNKEIEAKSEVKCQKCSKKFNTGELKHSYE